MTNATPAFADSVDLFVIIGAEGRRMTQFERVSTIMYTNNTASRGIPTTYSQIRAECEELLKIAKELEQIAFADSAFLESDRFLQLMTSFRDHFLWT
jgi:hypothetical protein